MHDVHLVDRRQAASALGRDLEAAARDPLHLRPRVLARVEPGAVVAGALGAEVEAADELAHDHHVDARSASRSQVRVDAELLAEPEQPLLGPNGLALELGEPDSGEQDGVGLAAGRERLGREGIALRENCVAAECVLRVADPERVEHPNRLCRDLGPDPVAREDDNVGHAATSHERVPTL